MIITTPTLSTLCAIQHKSKNLSKASTLSPLNNHSPPTSLTMNSEDNIKKLKATLEELKVELIKTEEIECNSLKTVQQRFLNHLIAKVQREISSLEQKEN